MTSGCCAPNFLIISPPRTASTWLAAHLGDHPRVFIPRAKELHYFNYFHRYFDTRWYLSHFAGAANRVRGEATPMPALDVDRMRDIQALCPDVRLIFIVREPRAHAWSVLRHAFAHNRTAFGGAESLSRIPDDALIRHLSTAVAVVSTDFEWCLSQWLSVFDRSQFYVDFDAQVQRNPSQLLVNVLRHIGITDDIPRCDTTLAEVVNASTKAAMPHRVKRFLDALYIPKAKALSRFLESHFALTCPSEWSPLLHVPDPEPFTISGGRSSPCISVVAGKFQAAAEIDGRQHIMSTAEDLDTLEAALASTRTPAGRVDALAEVAERQAAAAFVGRECVVFGAPPGHTLVHTRRRLFAVSSHVAISDATRESDLERYVTEGQAIEGGQLNELYLACTPTNVLELADGWNVVAFRGKYYAISQTLGAVDLANASPDWMQSHVRAGLVHIADTLQDATNRTAMTAAPAESSAHAAPYLLESLAGYNIVSYASQIFGVPQSAGPLHVDSPGISDVPGVIIEASLSAVRAGIEQRHRQTAVLEQPLPQLLESLDAYNIVSFQQRYYAVPQAAGRVAVDSPDIRSVSGVIIESSLDTVRARIREARQSECSS